MFVVSHVGVTVNDSMASEMLLRYYSYDRLWQLVVVSRVLRDEAFTFFSEKRLLASLLRCLDVAIFETEFD